MYDYNRSCGQDIGLLYKVLVDCHAWPFSVLLFAILFTFLTSVRRLLSSTKTTVKATGKGAEKEQGKLREGAEKDKRRSREGQEKEQRRSREGAEKEQRRRREGAEKE